MVKAPTGTRDVLPPESERWQHVVTTFARRVGDAGYGLLISPMFEEVEVFRRVGEGTDVVGKEMYEFEDRGGRRLALRPEGTASVVRAFVEHHPPTPFKVWYVTPAFRYERPQAGRYRQHHQLGVEALGPSDPDLDVEVIALAARFLADIGLQRVLLLINSMGDPATRAAYTAELRRYLTDHLGDLAPEDREKVRTHPLRVLDSKRRATREVIRDAPRLIDHLDDAALSHFERVQAGLGALGIPFAIEPRLVRGLDYYTHTTFEFQATALDAAQNTVCGGGRYDGLVEAMGGPPTPGVGFGLGIERLLLAAEAEHALPDPDPRVRVFVVDVTGGDVARDLTFALRDAGIGADRSFDGRSMRAQMKAADRSGAELAVIVGEAEREQGVVSLKPLRDPDAAQRTVPADRLVETVREMLGERR